MKTMALLLVTASFLIGSFLSVLDPQTVNWKLMIPVLLAGMAGLMVYRRAQHSAANESLLLSGNIENLGTCLGNIVANLKELNDRREDLPTYEARFEIDRLFRRDLENFADARESMIHVFGVQDYADVMSNFAAGERYINRVWSASTDGYVDEVKLYLERAHDQFIEAHRHFQELKNLRRGAAGNPAAAS